MLILLPLYNNVERIYLRRLIVFFDLRTLRCFLVLRFCLPPLNTVIGGLYTPVAGSIENWRAISIVGSYLLRVVLRPLRVFFEALRPLRPLRVLRPPFNGIPVG